MRTTLWKIIKCARGQMAIFIALIFQVLFVFFAMVINIGLLVHDKINLQNSVDLAAYYAASKQAQVLNAIAHANYQIRQSYKLLAYRLRVVGGFGYLDHPAHPRIRPPYGEVMHPAPVGPGLNLLLAEHPSVCITHRQWKDFVDDGDESLCQSQTNTITEIPTVPVIFNLNPLNAQTSSFIEDIKRRITQACERGALANWRFAAIVNYIYKKDVARRKIAVMSLASLLAKSQVDFMDLDNQSVYEGAVKTLKKNLTISNRNGLDESKLYFFNSMGTGAQDSRVPWLADIPIDPVIRYILHTPGGGKACANRLEVLSTFPPKVDLVDPDSAFRSYIGEPENTNIYHSSKGFEKNPWFMAYVGIGAQSAPRQIFAPFGGTVTLKAVAFAKPFGGRIGPWETRSWPRGAMTSDAGGVAVDPLSVPRNDRLKPQGNLAADSIFLPNYSKYPGDKLGLKSTLALSMGKTLLNKDDVNLKISTDHYRTYATLHTPDGDALPFDQTKPDGGSARMAELAAIAPDLFDVMYYSVENRFADYYVLSRPGGIAQLAKVINDHGRVPVFDQIATVLANPEFNYEGKHFFKLTTPSQTLTSWVQDMEGSYPPTSSKFASCFSSPNPKDPPAIGSCIVGGRTGYSVKIVSRDYLLSEEHRLGGDGVEPGSIMNPPPPFWEQ